MKELSKIIDCFGTTEALTVGLDGAAHRHILLRRNDTPLRKKGGLEQPEIQCQVRFRISVLYLRRNRICPTVGYLADGTFKRRYLQL